MSLSITHDLLAPSQTEVFVKDVLLKASRSFIVTFSICTLSSGGNVALGATMGGIAALVGSIAFSSFHLFERIFADRSLATGLLGIAFAASIASALPFSFGIPCDLPSTIFLSVMGSWLFQSELVVCIPKELIGQSF